MENTNLLPVEQMGLLKEII